jgi:hypothetical protein
LTSITDRHVGDHQGSRQRLDHLHIDAIGQVNWLTIPAAVRRPGDQFFAVQTLVGTTSNWNCNSTTAPGKTRRVINTFGFIGFTPRIVP